jgi:hypothetical protein
VERRAQEGRVGEKKAAHRLAYTPRRLKGLSACLARSIVAHGQMGSAEGPIMSLPAPRPKSLKLDACQTPGSTKCCFCYSWYTSRTVFLMLLYNNFQLAAWSSSEHGEDAHSLRDLSWRLGVLGSPPYLSESNQSQHSPPRRSNLESFASPPLTAITFDG